MRSLVTGATGLLGSRLCSQLKEVVVLGRDPVVARSKLGHETNAFAWSPELGPPPVEAFSGVDAVFHLAGEPIANGRWTVSKKRRIQESRVEGTKNLVSALKALDDRPSVLIAASAVGYYGDRGDEILTESASAGTSFLAQVTSAWEAASLRATMLGMRVVVARTGLVLAPEGGH